ncbi:dsRNA-specific ribonuclease [Synechococcus sp. PCC 7502]|uniref:ribonuclease III family protein n=1 Tax=Synechococcus sp. PCC 7502 TaxID=1173263 RepID=UPI00029F9214|nr:ribonuclease III domain-containing protein [Synechococcus sp. PCC 7502]AFY73392.1 dsRNA-specific ribonuclease [Synechococcus sp. PCC 7502]
MIAPSRQRELRQLLNRIQIPEESINWNLLDQALIHPSFSTVHNNDYLEFFGDSVLRMVVVTFLREQYGDRSVGDLAALRSHLVSDKVLAAIADGYGFDRFLVMGESAKRDPKTSLSRLANSFEAVLAALYLSTNDFRLINQWLYPHLQRISITVLAQPAFGNSKAALQELTQANWHILPEYKAIDSSEPQIFMVEVWVNNFCWGVGKGSSIKAAQQEAAAIALPALTKSLNSSAKNKS